ncbi:unnamed protein product [Rotaria socialis]|uniref:Uncharacterized protein n=1 Tax=Rotaria socialis TaxID=392032 RepID=A0A821QA59_9BILA|nr:unnamed protein product [Rotaria socialis]CAF4821112.1 unnamed protein product [Rotaria socialis]
MIHNNSIYSYLLLILCSILNIYPSVCYNETSTPINKDSTVRKWNIILWDFLVSMLLGIIISTLVNHYQFKLIKSTIQCSTEVILNTYSKYNEKKNVRKIMKDLTNFIPLKSFKTYHIDSDTSMETIDILIDQAKQTQRFSFITYDDKVSEKKFFIIELIQPSTSIIVIIDRFQEANVLCNKTDNLLLVIFNESNCVQTWRDIFHGLFGFQIYDIFLYERIDRKTLVNMQDHFKEWYNKNFSHNENCGQLLNFIDIDGPLCSCSHRPCKFPEDKWSLSMAIMYAFHENFELSHDHIQQCLAITKLSHVIENEWTREQIQCFNEHRK